MVAATDGSRAVDVMSPPEAVLHPEQDQEEGARLVLTTELLAVRVVDDFGKLLGLVTVDDAMEVLQLEESEDAALGAARQPLGRPYLAASPVLLARTRVVWLLVLALAATLTVNVLRSSRLRVGLILGGVVGVLALGPVSVFYDGRLAATVALTLVSICTLATMVGSVLPILAARMGLDPAVVSAPFVTTLVDASGLIVYFVYARAIFAL